MSLKSVKKDERVVSANDFGFLVEDFIRGALNGRRYEIKWLDGKLREWWPLLEEYYQRHIQSAIEVAIALDEPPRYNRQPLEHKEVWVQFIKDFRPGKSAFTVDYHCHKCKTRNVKLWRGVHGCADDDGNKLLCASCLAPEAKVDEDGKWTEPGEHGMHTDQVKSWLPAVPVDDTYWGYSSVPSQDVEWWVGLPTYPTNNNNGSR